VVMGDSNGKQDKNLYTELILENITCLDTDNKMDFLFCNRQNYDNCLDILPQEGYS
jgi:hypothetical protein